MTVENIAEQFEQCIKCGLCLATCPVGRELMLEKYTPRGKVQLARFHSQGALPLSERYQEVFAKCLLCGACNVTCPSGVDLAQVFEGMREAIGAERGLHPRLGPVVEALETNRNIADEDNAERTEWRDPLKALPAHLYEKDTADVAYFVGCVASFFPMVQGIPQNLVRLMERAGIDFAILGGEEWCCGFPLLVAGAPEKAQELIAHNLEKVTGLGAERVVFNCPSCYRTWKEHYATGLSLLHATQMLAALIEEGALQPGRLDAVVTYHDPCDLGRHGGEFEAPRRILRAIPGLQLKELENNRARSVCCGGGGNVEMVDPALSGAVAQRRIEEILATGADVVVTACQQCVRTLKSRVRRQRLDLEVLDITDVLLRSLRMKDEG